MSWSRRRFMAGALCSGLVVSAGRARAAVTDAVTLGAVLPFSGELAAYGAQARIGIDQAVAEVNAGGGVGGRPLNVLYEDNVGDSRVSVERAVRLVHHRNAVAIVGPVSSVTRNVMTPVLDRLGVPLLYATTYEGGACARHLFCFGTVPNQDLAYLVPHVARVGGGRFFLIGADYVWPDMMFRRARSIIASLGAEVVGEELLPWGLRDFGRLLTRVRQSGASTLLLALPGHDGLHLLDQAERSGVLEGRTVADLGINEALLSTLPPGRAEGLFCSVPMVTDSPEPKVRDFVARIRRRAGPSTVVEGFTLLHYNAVMACAAALRKAGEVSRAAVVAGLPGLTLDSPTGPVTIGADHHVTLSVYLARRAAGRLTVVRALGRIPPESGC